MTPVDDVVLVVDFGAQYARLIARRVREAHVYSEIVAPTMSVAEIVARRPKGIILSGGPKSVYEVPAPSIDPAIYDAGIPILGICYGAQLLVQQLGGTVAHTGRGEYGRTQLSVSGPPSPLFVDWPADPQVWMSHGDAITEVPEGFVACASSPEAPVAALYDPERRIHGVQFHPEVVHTDRGKELIERFCQEVCGIPPTWTHVSIIESQVEAVRAQVGPDRVLCALSGGVDSAVAAALVHKAIGDQLTCVFVDTGLMRAGEADQVEETFRRQFHVDLIHVKAADRFFEQLAGVTDPERKRKIIGELFIRIFEEVARDLGAGADAAAHTAAPRFLVQGTLYPDVIESGSGSAANIKSHHNVGGLPEDLAFDLIEPLRLLFKDEVRAVGEELGLPHEIVWRQPFPGPGLAVRIVGEVTPERADDPAGGRRRGDRGDPQGRPLRRAVAELRRAAGRAHRGRDGRRPDLRLPDRDPGGDERRRHDRRLGPPALRPGRADGLAHHQRGRRGEPGGARRDLEAPGHHRVGVSARR